MKMFDARKTGMTGLRTVWWKNYDDTLSRFHTIPACHGQTDGQTDRRTDGQNYYINIARQQQYADARLKPFPLPSCTLLMTLPHAATNDRPSIVTLQLFGVRDSEYSRLCLVTTVTFLRQSWAQLFCCQLCCV